MKVLDYEGLKVQIAKEKERLAQIEQRLEQLAADIADGSITTAKLADKAVTSVKLANGAVVPGKFSPGEALTSANPISNTNPPPLPAGQMQLHTVYLAGGPTEYGNLLNIGGGGCGQLFLGWSGEHSSPGDPHVGALYYRSKRDIVNGFTIWRKIKFE